jgi:hypothetical protein
MLAVPHRCSSDDAEVVVLAQQLACPLLTFGQKLPQLFPSLAARTEAAPRRGGQLHHPGPIPRQAKLMAKLMPKAPQAGATGAHLHFVAEGAVHGRARCGASCRGTPKPTLIAPAAGAGREQAEGAPAAVHGGDKRAVSRSMP